MFFTLKHGWQISRGQWKIAAIVYFFQFCLAVTLGVQVLNVLESSIGSSLEINKLMKDFDYTILIDLLKVHGASITPLIGHLRWMILIYLIFSVFIDGGLLACAARRDGVKTSDFWVFGAHYFFPFLKSSAAILGIAILWTAILWLPFLTYAEPSLEFLPSEKYIVWTAVALLVLYILGIAGLFIWSVLTRFYFLKIEQNIGHCLVMAFRFTRRHFRSFLLLLGVFVLIQVFFIAFYLLLETLTGMTTPPLIALFFVIQQSFVFLKIQLRQMVYAAMFLHFDANYTQATT